MEVYRTEDVLLENPNRFEDMMLKEPILKGLKEAGFLTPSPIQSAAIPVAMLSADLIAQAKSGTGKTCVFVTAVLNSIDFSSFRTQALVLAPTREIAVQIRDVFREIGKHIDNFECHSFIGGIQMKADIQLLKLGCQVAVGTPGRVHDLIEKAHLKTMFLQIVVLDEADQLFGPSFEETIIQILSMVPKQKQLMAFTATLLDDVEEKISSHMHEPEFVAIDQLKPSLKGVKQFYKKIDPDAGDDSEESRVTHAHKLLKQKVEILIEILTNTSFNQAVVFSNNKRRAHDIAETLTKNGWPTQHIHGGQAQTQRLAVFEKLRNFKIRVLVSSDVTARGIDIERLTLVINLDIPHNAETYMHRVGRTGRFGTKGVAVTFVTPGETVQFDEMVKKLQAIVEPLPPKIDQDMLNLWLKEGEEDVLKELEKHRERAQEKEVIPLREPMVQPFAKERRKKRKRGKKQPSAEKKDPIEARFLSGQTVMATRWEAWHQASVIDLTDGNHVVKLQWDDKENTIGTRSIRDVVAKKKPSELKTGMTYLGNFDGSWYICKIKKIDETEGTVAVEWAYHEGEDELDQNDFLCYEPFEEHSFEKRQAMLDSDEERENLTPMDSNSTSMVKVDSELKVTRETDSKTPALAYQINCEEIHATHRITDEEVSAMLRVCDEETNARFAKQNQKADYRIQNETNFAVLKHQPKTPISGALSHDRKQNKRGENNFNALPHQMETPAIPKFEKKFKRQVSLESMNLDGSDGIEVDIDLAKRIDDLIASSSSSNSLGRNHPDLTKLHEQYTAPEGEPWDMAHCDTFIEMNSAEKIEYARSSAPSVVNIPSEISDKFDKKKGSSGSKSPTSSDYQRLLARNTMANTTPGLHPVKPRKRTKKRRKQTEDPKTPQFSPFARMEHGFGESAGEYADCARSVAPSVVSVGISEPKTKEEQRREQTTDPQTPQFSPYVIEHPSLNDSAKEHVEYARSVAPSVISVAISRPQVPPSPWYPPIPDPTKNRQEDSTGKQQSPQRSQSSQPKQQEMYSQPPQQQPYSQPQQAQPTYSQPQQAQPPYSQPQQAQPPYSQPQQAQPPYSQPQQAQPLYSQPQQAQPPYSQPQQAQPPYSQPQPPYSQPQHPQYQPPVQQHNPYPQPFQQPQPTYSRPQHPSSFIQPEYCPYGSMKFPRVMHRPEVFYPPVLPPAPACSNPDVVSQCSLQAAKWLLQNGYI